MDSPRTGKVKRGLILCIQTVALSVFVGIAAYGVMTYWGGETHEDVPVKTSLLLGFLAVICAGVIVYIGGIQDRIAHRDDMHDNSE